jgi:hypothetical protein
VRSRAKKIPYYLPEDDFDVILPLCTGFLPSLSTLAGTVCSEVLRGLAFGLAIAACALHVGRLFLTKAASANEPEHP